MTKREEAEQATRCAVCADALDELATIKCTRCGAALEQRAALLARNVALEEAVAAINAAKGNMSAWRASRIIRALKKET